MTTPPSTAPHFTSTIRDQVGVATLMRIGARDLTYDDKPASRYLQFTVTGKRGYITTVKVILDPSDTYTVELNRMSKRTYDTETVHSAELVHAAELAEVVRRFCGE